MGRCFPEENTLSDAVLLINDLLTRRIKKGEIAAGTEENPHVPAEVFEEILEECKDRYGNGFNKTYREMTTRDFCRAVSAYMTELGFIQETQGEIGISPAVGKIAGQYPKDFAKENEREKQ